LIFDFFTFSTSVCLRVVSLSKVPKMTKKIFLPSARFIVGPDILSYSLYKSTQIFFTMWTLWVSKDVEFYVDFINMVHIQNVDLQNVESQNVENKTSNDKTSTSHNVDITKCRHYKTSKIKRRQVGIPNSCC
jgi:hypothetical protein